MPPQSHWRLATARTLALDRPRVMGIVNVTPDSFADVGKFLVPAAAADAAARFVVDGADVLDIGGESTRPGAAPVPPEEQIRRVVPVIARIRALPGSAGGVPISVDTTRAAVARAALDAGADAINDVSAGTDDPELIPLVAHRGAGLILMHRLCAPRDDSYSDRYAEPPEYTDVVRTVRDFLAARAQAAIAAGVARGSIVLDPGLGFGKTVAHNMELIRRTQELASLGFPVLSALSLKSFVGRVSLGRDSSPGERLPGTVALTLLHLANGARIFRVHHVAPVVQALRAWEAVTEHAPGNVPAEPPGTSSEGGITLPAPKRHQRPGPASI